MCPHCSTFASVMESEIYNFLVECCNARKSHAMEYKSFVGAAAIITALRKDEVEEYVVAMLRENKVGTLLFGGRCYLFNNNQPKPI